MKLKATDDFKKGAKGVVYYTIAAIVVFPIFHLIKGDFERGDTLINAGLMILICLVLGIFSTLACRFRRKRTTNPKSRCDLKPSFSPCA